MEPVEHSRVIFLLHHTPPAAGGFVYIHNGTEEEECVKGEHSAIRYMAVRLTSAHSAP